MGMGPVKLNECRQPAGHGLKDACVALNTERLQ
jgi:hypothetical protein